MVQCQLYTCPTGEILPVTVYKESTSHRDGVTKRGIFTQRQFYLFHLLNYLTAVVVFGELRVKRRGISWSQES
jgi:hypothetical protein